MNLRPYQTAAIEACRDHLRKGGRHPLIVCPTGGGKTCIAASIAAAHEAKGGKVLFIAPRVELVEQSDRTMALFGSKAHATTIQALAMSGRRPDATMLILDECRHYMAEKWREVVRHYEAGLIIGLDATPARGDGIGCGEVFDGLIVAASIGELTAAGHLVPCEVIAPARMLRSRELAQDPVAAYKAHAGGRKAVVFCTRVAESEELATRFAFAGIRAVSIDGVMAPELRASRLQKFADGRMDVICNVNVLTEGWDCPSAEVCIIARGCNAGLYIQMVGRVLRPHPGKTAALLIDLRGVTNQHGAPSEERDYSLDGVGIRRKGQDPSAPLCRVCGAVLEDGRCPDCGIEKEAYEVKILNERLVKFAGMRAKSHDEKRAYWQRLLSEAAAKGYKSSWAKAKYRAVMGEWPA